MSETRPPIVAVMGHIDHGKSTLLDYIRKTNTTAKEAGGITQRMSAYKVTRENSDGKEVSITFLDTPGHAAFEALRSRGARVADIGILVVAADEGVKPQTLEALKSIKEAGLPYIVAINKIDRPNANVDRTKQSLGDNEIYVEGWGGDIPFVPVSAVTGEGVDALLDMVLLVAELQDLKADKNAKADGLVIGAENSKTKGISATLMVKNGTLKSGDYIVVEETCAPTRIMEDFTGKAVKEAGPSDPVRIIGFNTLPPVGATFEICASKKEAEKLCEECRLQKKKSSNQIEIGGENETSVSIPLIIKAATTDVIEAILHEIQKIKNDRVALKIVSTGVGFVSESDVKLALTKEGSVIVGFDTPIDSGAKALAERNNVRIEVFSIIYKLAEWLEEFMKERTPKMKVEEMRGRAKVLRSFSRTKDKQVIGCRVESGSVFLGDEVKILRRDAEIGKGRIKALQQMKNEAKEVKEGNECGVMVESKFEIAPGDYLESFNVVEK
ncbi:MAG TPA: translation initiation factor IF-2 [Candidatus Paceibacterota bacterium]|nr:translation initiation factor IF-2 [Candidatus Paceibacterota bacterium]